RDRGLGGETLLDRLQRRVPGRIAEPGAVGPKRHRDEIRMIERHGALLVGGVVERPVRRRDLPDIASQRAAVLFEPGAAALGVEIILYQKRCSCSGATGFAEAAMFWML